MGAIAHTPARALPPVYFDDGGSEGNIRGNSADATTRIEADMTLLLGNWTNGGSTFTVERERWKWNGQALGPVKVVGISGDVLQVDMYLNENAQGQKIQAIFRRDRDALYYCGTYGPTRPIEFRAANGIYYIVWKPVGK
jgi:hypothetical protein